MHLSKRRAQTCLLTLVAVNLCACPPPIEQFDGHLPDSQSGFDAGPSTPPLYDWHIERAFDETSLSGAPLAFAVGPGGQLAFAYYGPTDPPAEEECQTNYGVATIVDSELRLARYDGSAWTIEVVQNVHSRQAVAATYGADGNMHLAYMAGDTTGTMCADSQLNYRRVTTASLGSASVLTPNSATGTACRLMQNACELGDTIGRFPSMAVLPDSRVLLAYQDVHYGFGQQTDFEGADLEIVLGNAPLTTGGRRCLDDSSGAGYFSKAFAGRENRGAIAHVVIQSHQFNSTGALDHPPVDEGTSYNWVKGIYLVEEQSDGTWLNNYIFDVSVTERLAAAYAPGCGYAVAYKLGSSLAARVSADGVTWTAKILDANGRTGLSPDAVVDGEGRILVAYGRCSTAAGASTCPAAQDGVRLAACIDGQWRSENVVNDSDRVDGVEVHIGVDPDNGYPVIAYRDATANRMMIARATPHQE